MVEDWSGGNLIVYVDGPASNYPIAVRLLDEGEPMRGDLSLAGAKSLRDWLSARIEEMEGSAAT